METNEMENIWKAENERLKSKLYVNEKLILKTYDKSVNSFKDLFNASVMGRNMALVYATISLTLAVIYASELRYSIPLILGAAGMVISFIQHLALKSPKDYHRANIIELQKSIQKFRIHTMKHKYYDMFFVTFWLLTLSPLYYKWKRGLDVFGSSADLLKAVESASVILLLLTGFSFFIYNHYDKKLSKSIANLKELEEFESESN